MKVSLRCPICQKENNIEIPDDILAQKEFGSIKIQIPPGAVCPDHQFIVFLGVEGKVRGYERIDVFMGREQEERKIEEISEGISLNQLVEEFGLYGVFSLIHSKLFSYLPYVVRDDISEEFSHQLNEYLNEITDNNYSNPLEIKILKKPDFDVLNIDEDNTLILDENNNIIHTPWGEKLSLEEGLIRDALDILNPSEQKIIIKQRVDSFLKTVKHTVRILNDLKKNKKINNQDLMKKLTKDLNRSDISHNYVEIIKCFIIRNISRDLGEKIIKRTEDFLSAL